MRQVEIAVTVGLSGEGVFGDKVRSVCRGGEEAVRDFCQEGATHCLKRL